MRTQLIGIVLVGSAVVPPSPCQAQQPPRDQPERRSEGLLNEMDEVRIQVELLEMEIAADKRQIQKLLDILAEARLHRGDQPEEHKADIERLTRMYEEVRVHFANTSKELIRARRRLRELEERTGRPDDARPSNTERRIRAIERIISEILREIED